MDCTCITSLFTHLWLPVLASAAAVWIASAVVWMFLPHHRNDWKRLPDEDGFIGAVRGLNIPPGMYGFPHFGSHGECNSPEAREKWKTGPVGLLNVWNPNVSMGRNMLLSFLVYVVISVFIAYLGAITIGAGVPFLRAFQVFGTAGVLAYSFSFIPSGIWFQRGRSNVTCVLDGIAFGLITGAVMAALWPAAATMTA